MMHRWDPGNSWVNLPRLGPLIIRIQYDLCTMAHNWLIRDKDPLIQADSPKDIHLPIKEASTTEGDDALLSATLVVSLSQLLSCVFDGTFPTSPFYKFNNSQQSSVMYSVRASEGTHSTRTHMYIIVISWAWGIHSTEAEVLVPEGWGHI